MTLEYKKAYEREPKDDKSYDWKQKYSDKNLKALDYQPVKLEKNHCLMRIDQALNNGRY